MKEMCKKCDKRNDCVELCPKAEVYVNQDYSSQSEYLPKSAVGNNIKDVIEWNDSLDERHHSTVTLAVINLHKDGMKTNEIGYHVSLSKRRIREIIQEFKENGGF